MKLNHVLVKSGLALAIGAFSMGAMAGTHTVDAPGAVVLANEIFGAGSEATLVAIPVSTYAVANNAIGAGEQATVKFTLNKGAVFGEDLSDISKWAESNATLRFTLGGTEVAIVDIGGVATVVTAADLVTPFADATIVVDQGGAIGDNTVTFKITAAAATTLDTVKYGQVRVKNLTAALQRDGGLGPVSLGAEFRNVATAATDTQPAVVVLRSQNGVELEGTQTSYALNGERARIAVAANERKFTSETGSAASGDFDETNDVAFVDLGELRVVRTTYNNGTENVKKENGDDFDFQGSDVLNLTLTSTDSMAAFSSVKLVPVNAGCAAAAVKSATPSGNSVTIPLSGQTTEQLQAGYDVCAVAGGSAAIPESSFAAELNVTYFNPRYTNSQDTLEYGQILRNGCQVTLFNLPNVATSDKAMIRLTNVSNNPGSVRGFVWTEDGRQIDVGSVLSEKLDAHATTVFHTNPNLASGVFLGDVLPEFSGLTNGRHRLVLQGGFPACEALGMVRSPNGTLTNMTSTTYAGDDARLGENQSNTSNTTN